MTFEEYEQALKEIIRKAVYITPDIAKEYLDLLAEDQRSLSPYSVNSYAQEMREGHWNETLDPIAFCKEDGLLWEGQHRLRAVIKSGVPIKSEVCWNVPKELLVNSGRGRTRSIRDILKMRTGVIVDESIKAGIIYAKHNFIQADVDNASTTSKLNLVMSFGEIIPWLSELDQTMKLNRLVVNASMLGAAFAVIERDSKYYSTLYTIFNNGTSEDETPIHMGSIAFNALKKLFYPKIDRTSVSARIRQAYGVVYCVSVLTNHKRQTPIDIKGKPTPKDILALLDTL